MVRTTRSKGRTYRGFVIRLQSDDRYDVFENADAEKEGRPICDNFKEISTAMEWIDQTQFNPPASREGEQAQTEAVGSLDMQRELERIETGELDASNARTVLNAFLSSANAELAAEIYATLRTRVGRLLRSSGDAGDLRRWHNLLRSSAAMFRDTLPNFTIRLEVLAELLHERVGVLESATRPRRTEAGMIDLTPTWAATTPILIAAVRDGTDIGRRLAEEELMRMAKIMDNLNAGRPAEEGVPS